MKKKFLCLILALLMVVPCFMAGCGTGEEKDATEDVTEKASKTTKTLTMFMITERHVYTADEVAAIKAEKGETSKEYIEALGVMNAYINVAEALDKITKAKFRTHLIIYFYTIEEYKAVEELMEFQAKAAEMKKKAKDSLNKYKREQKALGLTDVAVIESMFYAEFPQYAPYTDATTAEETVVTEAETIVNEYGIKELKYPEAKPNQVDIVCVAGYDKYLEYIEKGWLAPLDTELSGSSKAITTYVNEKFLTAAKIPGGGTTYAIPNNTAIGEYTYFMLNKELFDFYQYEYNDLLGITSAITDGTIQNFLKDIMMYESENYVPLTGNLDLTNTFFWSVDYEYESVGTLKSFDKNTIYYARSESQNEDGETVYTYHRVVKDPVNGTTYYTQSAPGVYEQVKFEDKPAFKKSTVYFTKDKSGVYTRIYTFDPNTEYFTVNAASFNGEEFSVLGYTGFPSDATTGTEMKVDLMSSQYAAQMIALKNIFNTEGLYDAEAFNDPEKKFAAACVKGTAALEAEYGDEYYMLVIEYPRATVETICQNLIGVSATSTHLASSMEVITYLNTNADFRNILQYGIKDTNAAENVEPNYTVEDINGYPRVKRLNNYYQMDLYKTGNTFIAYPEENMVADIWEYGKKQNADAKFHPMIEFDLTSRVNSIDFTVLDQIKALSKTYKDRIDACKTAEELEEVLAAMEVELAANTFYKFELRSGVATQEGQDQPAPETYNGNGIYHNYFKWWWDKY